MDLTGNPTLKPAAPIRCDITAPLTISTATA